MQYIVARHNITVYHTCILHSVINVFCTLVQKRCYVIDAKDSEIQYFKVHITNSLQLLADVAIFLVLGSTQLKSAAKLLLFFDMCKGFYKNSAKKLILLQIGILLYAKHGVNRGNRNNLHVKFRFLC